MGLMWHFIRQFQNYFILARWEPCVPPTTVVCFGGIIHNEDYVIFCVVHWFSDRHNGPTL